MRIHEIFYYFKTYLLFGIMGFIVLASMAAFVYFFIYKRKLKGNREFSRKQLFIGGLFIAYILMVFGVTFLSRGSHFHGSINIHFLSSYREAWNSFSARSWQFIILNIIMFMPFGFLLPLLYKKFHNIFYTIIAALLLTLSIELFQLATGMGIFEFDDIFNNTLGAFIGYGMIMALISAFKSNRNRSLKIIGYLSPLIITVTIFIGIFVYYDNKELGNLVQNYSYKINLSKTNIELNTSLKENKDSVPIYQAPTFTKEESLQWVKDFLRSMDIDIDNIEIDPYNDNAVFWVRGEPTYNIRFNYIGGKYNFLDFSCFEDGLEPMNVEEDLVLEVINAFGIGIPEEAKFTNEDNGDYQWKADQLIDGDILMDGAITCTYFNDHTIKSLNNNLIKYKKVKDISIKSEKDAFEELTKGKFRYHDDNITSITIEQINLDYLLDTKGFYQPVYRFKAIMDEKEHSIIIPAIN